MNGNSAEESGAILVNEPSITWGNGGYSSKVDIEVEYAAVYDATFSMFIAIYEEDVGISVQSRFYEQGFEVVREASLEEKDTEDLEELAHSYQHTNESLKTASEKLSASGIYNLLHTLHSDEGEGERP